MQKRLSRSSFGAIFQNVLHSLQFYGHFDVVAQAQMKYSFSILLWCSSLTRPPLAYLLSIQYQDDSILKAYQ
eukprot:5950823-Amphidinium_carterae.1